MGVFPPFLNCTNGTKSRNASHMQQETEKMRQNIYNRELRQKRKNNMNTSPLTAFPSEFRFYWNDCHLQLLIVGNSSEAILLQGMISACFA